MASSLVTRRAVFATACAIAAWSASAFAQTPPSERPYRGLFGQRNANLEQSLSASGSVGAGYDDNLGDSPDNRDANELGGAGFGQVSGSLTYGLDRGGIQVSASGDASLRYYAPLADDLQSAYAGTAAVGVQLSQSTHLSSAASLSYQPLIPLAGFPTFDQGPSFPDGLFSARGALGLDAGARGDEFPTYAASVGLSHRVTQRGTLSIGYAYGASHMSSDSAMSSHSGSAGYSYSISKGLSVRAGYGRSQARYGDAPDQPAYSNDNIDAGLAFDRALGATRRTRISFSTGATVVRYQGERQYSVIGDAQLRREIARTWSAAVGYSRTVQYIETFGTPVFADAMTVAVGGELNRRMHFRSQINAAVSQLPMAITDSGFNTYSASGGVNMAMGRHAGLAADYMLYRHDSHGGAAILSGLPRTMTRHGVMVSLTLWLPIVETARRADASR